MYVPRPMLEAEAISDPGEARIASTSCRLAARRPGFLPKTSAELLSSIRPKYQIRDGCGSLAGTIVSLGKAPQQLSQITLAPGG